MSDTPLRRLGCVAGLAVALLAGCADRPTGPIPVAAAPAGPAPEYRIGPGDGLSVFVYQVPELSSPEVVVRPDGRISLPLVPDIEASGRTPSQLARGIEERLKRFVIEPNVSVMVRSFVGLPGQQVRVIGEAAQPMTVPYREGMTLLDVMIEAKGLTRYAAGNRAEIIRLSSDGRSREGIRVRLADLLRDGDVSQDMPLRPGDTLVIPAGWF
jgi:polysaccharide export outer membrane protein